ncbi:TPA: hypothetical protein QDA86_003006 [Burkholderia vietnamiensis]|nr:hypothetical protein [Burkholderia vietnamiensis]
MTLVELESTFAAIGRFLEKRTEALNGGSGASTHPGQTGRVRSARRKKKRK